MKFKITKRKWSKWKDISIITTKGNWYLLQVREDLDNGEKEFKQRSLGWINDNFKLEEIKRKLEL